MTERRADVLFAALVWLATALVFALIVGSVLFHLYG